MVVLKTFHNMRFHLIVCKILLVSFSLDDAFILKSASRKCRLFLTAKTCNTTAGIFEDGNECLTKVWIKIR